MPKPKHPRFLDRFTGRADDYARYRPTYPRAIITYLKASVGFDRTWVVADVGSGTGILSELFLGNGNKVYCVEPNRDMRQAAETNLARYHPSFLSVNGSAEATRLEPNSVDLITAGQALHWFDMRGARREFIRILRKKGVVAVIYNHRREDKLGNAYEAIIDNHREDRPPIPDVDRAYVSKFLGIRSVKKFVVPNSQTLGFVGLMGRIASASYMPPKDNPAWKDIEDDVRKVIHDHGRRGKVALKYDTTVYLGRVKD